MQSDKSLSRRNFLGTSAAAAAGFMVVPRYAAAGSPATPAHDRLNIAAIGAGGMGAGDIGAVSSDNNIVALCDVDLDRCAGTLKKHPKAKVYRDFRRMFDEMEKGIDAVIVATPDHFHAVAAMAAIKRGKHVYCEKPLAHSVYEVRELMAAAHKHKVVTQLGNQGHSFGTIRTFCEWIWDGAIGKVHTIHAGCRGINSALDELPKLAEKHPVPANLDWDLWLGPALERPYHPAYLPGRWRHWVPFGTGTVGDWTCHVVDPVFWALDLGAPATVQASVKDYDPATQGDTYPRGEVITYEFPGNQKRGPITMKWHSGTEAIPRPPELESDEKDIETGAVVMGDKGTIVYGSHGAGQVRLIPQAKMDAYKKPSETIPRVKEHHWEWVQCIRNGGKTGSDFSYGGPLTELALLGVIAILNPGQKLEWDTKKCGFRNSSAANKLINPPRRRGWEL